MDTFAGQRIQIDGHGGHKGLALAGSHLRNHAPVEDDAAQKLNVERALSKGAFGRFSNGGEGVNQQVVEVFAALQAVL